jgi:hypothetical protein
MRVLGLDVGQCRLPMGEADDVIDATAQRVVSALLAARD